MPMLHRPIARSYRRDEARSVSFSTDHAKLCAMMAARIGPFPAVRELASMSRGAGVMHTFIGEILQRHRGRMAGLHPAPDAEENPSADVRIQLPLNT